MKKIKLSQGKCALVDDEDYEALSQYTWCAVRCGQNWYAQRWPTTYMHCQLLGWKGGIDHKNHNGLDNRRKNLRRADQSANVQNRRKRKGTSSRFLGVSWNRGKSRWQVIICKDGKNRYVGSSKDEEEAARLYDFAALQLYDSPQLNFPRAKSTTCR